MNDRHLSVGRLNSCSLFRRRKPAPRFSCKCLIISFNCQEYSLAGSVIQAKTHHPTFFFPGAWTAFVQWLQLEFLHSNMKTEQAIEGTRQALRRQHKALATEETYLFWLRRYVLALRNMPETLSSGKKVEHFLTDTAIRQNVAASTQNPRRRPRRR